MQNVPNYLVGCVIQKILLYIVIWSNVIGISDTNVMFKGPGPLHEVGLSDSNLGVLLFFLNTDSIQRLCAFLFLPPSFSPIFFMLKTPLAHYPIILPAILTRISFDEPFFH